MLNWTGESSGISLEFIETFNKPVRCKVLIAVFREKSEKKTWDNFPFLSKSGKFSGKEYGILRLSGLFRLIIAPKEFNIK